ncbi:MAG: hypothetical protein JOZ56_03575 [Actinobacteria bacterium]|nr:hypothetical protein [Actinomycetota bacterium]MBV8562148.1 hypothetical protein [Actinomycetota bacterium]
MNREQVVTIAALATTFTVVCESCAHDDASGYGGGSYGQSFAGRLDLDLDGGVFLCRRGHTVVVERERPAAEELGSAAAA